jgi:5-methyltetrahydropteroyltriglutamate--homocysteine methyltransferase
VSRSASAKRAQPHDGREAAMKRSTTEAYLCALADVMKAQYHAVVDSGFVLQLDCPDLALSRHTVFARLTLEAFRKVIEMHVEALNYAVRDLPPERMRLHICQLRRASGVGG